jgi:hypothetical protein
MKKVIRLTESDLTKIIKRVLNEEKSLNKLYFIRRGIDFDKIIENSLNKINVCSSVKLTTYFSKVLEKVIVNLYLHQLKTEFENDEFLEHKIKEYMIENELNFLIYYYKMKCGKDPKY